MGFERTRDGDKPNAERGFENSEIDLESDALEQLQTKTANRRYTFVKPTRIKLRHHWKQNILD